MKTTLWKLLNNFLKNTDVLQTILPVLDEGLWRTSQQLHVETPALCTEKLSENKQTNISISSLLTCPFNTRKTVLIINLKEAEIVYVIS